MFVIQKHFIRGSHKIVVFFREISSNEETSIEDFGYKDNEHRYDLYDAALKMLNRKINHINSPEEREIYTIEEVEEPEKENSEVLFLEKKSEVLKRIQESAKKLFDISKTRLTFKWNRYYDLVIRESPNESGLVEVVFEGKKENEESANQEICIDQDFDKKSMKDYRDVLKLLNRELDLVDRIISFEIPEHSRPKAVIRAPLLPDLPPKNIDAQDTLLESFGDIDAKVKFPEKSEIKCWEEKLLESREMYGITYIS